MKNLIKLTLFVYLLGVSNLFCQNNNSRANVFNEDYKIMANDGSSDDNFSHSIALDEGIVAVGTPFDDDNGTNSGAAYLFDAATGVQLMKLLPDDGIANAEFGFSIAIDNGIVAIGAKGDSENGVNAGAAYLFDALTGNQLYKLLPNDGATGDEFGNSIDLDNGIVVAGAWRADEFGDASGAAYLFDATTGSQLNKLLPDSGNNFQTFGVSVAIDNETVAVGARTFFVLGEGYTFAKAYLFNTTNGNQLSTLQPDILNFNGDLGGFFADCMDISDDLIAIGAPNRSVVFDHSGAAYVFDISSGTQLNFLVPNDAHDRDNFGITISIDNGIVAIGSHQDDVNGFNSGSAYFYDAMTGLEIDKVTASDGEVSDLFGCSIAVDGNIAVIGAKNDDDNGSNSGSAYIYSSTILGTPEADEDLISLYPNPGSERVTITLSPSIGHSVNILIYNSLGQIIKTITETNFNNDKSIVLDVSDFNSGVYFVAIRSGYRSITKKLLIN